MPRVADTGDQLPPASSPQIGGLPRLIHKPEVLQLTGVTFPTLWKWMREGTFPISFVVGGKTAWLESEIAEWISNRPRSQFKKNGG
jgi:predicted DNA-binding transcriptional regulator AlpA